MTNDNQVSAVLPAEARAAVLAAFDTILENLPFLINLPAADKKRMPTIGRERQGMVATYFMEMNLHAGLVPSFVDPAEVAKDRNLWIDMLAIIAKSNEVHEALQDTHHAIGSDLYLAFLAFYNNVKMAAKRNVPGMDSLLARLKPWFGRPRRTPPRDGSKSAQTVN